jgi:hypothetical protein
MSRDYKKKAEGDYIQGMIIPLPPIANQLEFLEHLHFQQSKVLSCAKTFFKFYHGNTPLI